MLEFDHHADAATWTHWPFFRTLFENFDQREQCNFEAEENNTKR